MVQLGRLISGEDQHEPVTGGAGSVKETVDGVSEILAHVGFSFPEEGVGFVDEQNRPSRVRTRPVEHLVYFLHPTAP